MGVRWWFCKALEANSIRRHKQRRSRKIRWGLSGELWSNSENSCNFWENAAGATVGTWNSISHACDQLLPNWCQCRTFSNLSYAVEPIPGIFTSIMSWESKVLGHVPVQNVAFNCWTWKIPEWVRYCSPANLIGSKAYNPLGPLSYVSIMPTCNDHTHKLQHAQVAMQSKACVGLQTQITTYIVQYINF